MSELAEPVRTVHRLTHRFVPQTSKHFPPDVVARLLRAANIDHPAARLIAIEDAIEWARIQYPERFK